MTNSNISKAIQVLRFHATDPAGANLLMRNGQNPGTLALRELSDTLTFVFDETARKNELDRDIAFYCGVFLQFKEDHREIMKSLSPSVYDALMLPLMDISQKAFDVLAGKHAADWGVELPKKT